MASYMDMSLEDIIQRNKRENSRSKDKVKATNIKKNEPRKKVPITDARNKIMFKKRTQISDAREKLAELAKRKDARLKLEQLRKKRAMMTTEVQGIQVYEIREKNLRHKLNKERAFIDRSRQVVSQPLGSLSRTPASRQINTKRFLENRSIESRSFGTTQRPQPITRTVRNDLDIIDDPMGDELVPPKTFSLSRKANLQLRIVARNNDVRENRTSLRRLTTPEKEKSPPRPTSILKKRPMAALRSEKKTEIPEKSLEYRIIVSNLRNTVTGGDIEELFGDVGGMMESRLVRPGTAEVIYKTMEDAQKAVELYHNRQLDGQPMNCLLVTPRSNAAQTNLPKDQERNSSKPALVSSNSNVEPDISTFHKVLFSNF